MWYPGDPDTSLKVLPQEIVTKLSKETGFERPELDAFWEQWTFMANTEWREDPDDLCLAMDRKTFSQCLVPPYGSRHVGPNLIYDRMFTFYDTNNDGLISFPEFLNGLAYRRKKDKLKKVFEGYDINGDGFVDRKDFLRIFRSYYTLYKQMDREILESLDDQAMNNTEAHQLVTGRQPLSAVFGREGRLPSAPDSRNSEGKTRGISGDFEIIDGKGVLSDNSNDFGNKEDVIIDAAVREFQLRELDSLKAWDPTESNTYWLAMSNPPTTLTELQHGVLDGLIRNRRQNLAGSGNSRPRVATAETGSFLSATAAEGGPIEESAWSPNFVTVEDVVAICGPGISIGDVPRSSRQAVIDHANERQEDLKLAKQTILAQQELHERWKRRQFYTDEEEGAVPPRDWKEEEDLPILNGKAPETPKEPTPLSRPISPRSRSSSKVRFVEDTDDFETRSNTSTASRSVPERWGGMDIPDAEKDVGREVLYQVTQQAFNELLDPLFKKQEDLAVEALSTVESRDLHRHLFNHPDFVSCWASEVDMALTESKTQVLMDPSKGDQQAWPEEHRVPEAGLEVRERPLSQTTNSEYTLNAGIDDPRAGLPAADESVDDEGSQERENIGSGGPSQTAPDVLGELNDSESLSCVARFLGVTEEEVMHRLLWRPQPDSTLVQDTAGPHSHATSPDSSHATPRSLPQLLDMTVPQLPDSPPSTTEPPNPLPPSHETSPRQEGISSSCDTPNIDGPDHVTLETSTATNGCTSIENPQHHVPDATPPPAVGPGSPQRHFDIGSENANRLLDAFLRADDPTDASRRNRPLQPPSPQTSHPALPTVRLPDTIPGPTQEKLHKLRSDILVGMQADLRAQFVAVDWMALYRLRNLDHIAKTADDRGGWARLSFPEFEALLKSEDPIAPKNTPPPDRDRDRDKKRALLDYLGSWIDLCIP